MGKYNIQRVSLSVAVSPAVASCGGGSNPGELGASASQAQGTEVARERTQLLATDGVLDASHWPAAAPYGYFDNGSIPLLPPPVLQPVKALASGRLTQVGMNLCVLGTSGSTVIQIRRVAAFLSPVIATAQVPRANSPHWGSAQCPGTSDMLASGQAEVTFDLSAANVDVTAGEEYSITLVNADPAGGSERWFLDFNGNTSQTSDNWLVLAQVQGSQSDLFGYRMRFRTYVAPVTAWAFSGFLAPLDPWPAMNRVRAGAVVPVKFKVGTDKGLDIFSAAPSSVVMNCDGSTPAGGPSESAANPGRSSLRYDAASGQYNYTWQTDASWANSCRQLVLRFKDGSTQRANFQFR